MIHTARSPACPPLPLASQLVLTYTASYDGWGIAAVSCLSGCNCKPAEIDAASKEKTSLLQVCVGVEGRGSVKGEAPSICVWGEGGKEEARAIHGFTSELDTHLPFPLPPSAH